MMMTAHLQLVLMLRMSGVKPTLLHIMASRYVQEQLHCLWQITVHPMGAAQHYCLRRQPQMSKGNENMVLPLIMQATAGVEIQFCSFWRTVLPSFLLSSSSRWILKMVALQCQCPATQHHISKGSSPQQHCC